MNLSTFNCCNLFVLVNVMKLVIVLKLVFIGFGETTRMNVTEGLNLTTLPDGFLMGVGVSALQTEGAWNESGKSETIWDHYTHTYPEKIADGSNVDVATDFYHKYKEDIQLVKDIGFNTFRFSISWSRIFPSGYAVDPNEDGLRFYHNVLDELKRQGITPFVTLHHFDHPQVLEDQLNGWLNESMAYAFADYAEFVFREYGSKVKYFTTINEPQAFCEYFYAKTLSDVSNSGLYYLCVHNIIKAHALAYRIYDKEFRHKQNGLVGIVQASPFFYNLVDDDVNAQKIAFELHLGLVSHPIFSKTGDYPDLAKQLIDERSRVQGLEKSKLPVFTQEWIERIQGSSDYFGLNHYTTFFVKSSPPSKMSEWNTDDGINYLYDSKSPSTQMVQMKIVPRGFRDLLNYIKNNYNDPSIFVTETGASDANLTNDTIRMSYIYSYTKELMRAINEDKCKVKSLIFWSLVDNFEFYGGYTIKFGLVHVDFEDKNRKRTLKESAKWLRLGFKTQQLLPPPFFND
ncbi:myrosinase 1-like [Copidosoma floridanum]|uniref:myrosinase 1-like n=1 Tax=Copidosoma floridanum TaxID=29053 RepID=UPI0006C96BEA|nr:myrosinase 1-like [Copidosoma floridanum]